MQRVGLGMQGIDPVEKVDMGRVAVIDGAGNITVFPAIGFPGLQCGHALYNRFGREAFRRYTPGAGQFVAIGLQFAFQGLHQVPGVLLDLGPDGRKLPEVFFDMGHYTRIQPRQEFGQSVHGVHAVSAPVMRYGSAGRRSGGFFL